MKNFHRFAFAWAMVVLAFCVGIHVGRSEYNKAVDRVDRAIEQTRECVDGLTVCNSLLSFCTDALQEVVPTKWAAHE